MPRTTPGTIHRLHITLRNVEPPVWRRVEVRSTTKLPDLAAMLERSMGWEGTHLHVFEASDGRQFGEPDPDFDDIDAELGSPVEDEAKHRVIDVLPADGATLRFDYDFGDGWEHDVLVEAIEPAANGTEYPRCIGGERACPPEDCGGPRGYSGLLAVLADPHHEQHEDAISWIGGEFDPEHFDPDEATELMQGPHRRGW